MRSTPQILRSLEGRVGCRIDLEPGYELAGRISFSDGRKFYFKNTSIDINSYGASEIAKDKSYARFFMENLGYRIPKGANFFSERWCEINRARNNALTAVVFAESIGYPVIVKPNSRNQGRDLFKAYNAVHLKGALEYIFEKSNVALVEEYIAGADYRVVVLDGEAPIAYERRPFSVLGNGVDSILRLIERKKDEFRSAGRRVRIESADIRIKERLLNFYNVNVDHVPELGERVVLLENANLSSGGEAEDVTDKMHQSYKDLAVKLSRDMGLRFAGVDFISADDISKPVGTPVFLEINSSPGLTHFQTISPLTEKMVEDLYFQILMRLKDA